MAQSWVGVKRAVSHPGWALLSQPGSSLPLSVHQLATEGMKQPGNPQDTNSRGLSG